MYCSSSITGISDSKRASSDGETQEANPERAKTRPRIWSGRGRDPESGAGGDKKGNAPSVRCGRERAPEREVGGRERNLENN
ncbi:hypothetical protein D623_10008367 [Myotis brandtii]|uniref:Uncharacterized protein n=1 Tax=Myotis brandtii TaxID=109478 RepID=S7NVM8_MYOBR|nr:hypothetical protein D623_10008367 [Myotis brandtii]